MHKSVALFLTANVSALLLVGCGQQPASTPPPTKPGKQAVSGQVAPPPAPPVGGPTGAPPPPPPPGVPASAATAAAAASDMVDETGKQLTTLEFLQQAVGQYDRLRPGSAYGDKPGWPPLTDLNQLIKVGLLKSLPTAPPGKKFVLDPKTMKVSLANQ